LNKVKKMAVLRRPTQNRPFWRTPLDADKREAVVGKVNIIASRCKGCGYCTEFCPKDILEASKDFNEKGYYPPVVKREGQCVNCTFCETICPEFAIYCTVAERRPIRPEDLFETAPLSWRERRRQSLASGAASTAEGKPGEGAQGSVREGGGTGKGA
jgi:2-oxoglutarate ferredoxin oxidoreductase subunit delta